MVIVILLNPYAHMVCKECQTRLCWYYCGRATQGVGTTVFKLVLLLCWYHCVGATVLVLLCWYSCVGTPVLVLLSWYY